MSLHGVTLRDLQLVNLSDFLLSLLSASVLVSMLPIFMLLLEAFIFLARGGVTGILLIIFPDLKLFASADLCIGEGVLSIDHLQ